MALFKQLLALVLALAVLNPLCCCLGKSADTPPDEKYCCAKAMDTGGDDTSPGDSPALPCQCGSRTKTVSSGGEAPLVPAPIGVEIPALPPFAVADALDIPTLNSALWATRARAPENAPPPVQRELGADFCVYLI